MLAKPKYINLLTDFAFKRIFGNENNKELLIHFLNELLAFENKKVVDLTFKNPEQLGKTDNDRRAVYDIYCQNQHGEKFIVELQKAKQNYFKERTVYYSTFPIREQAEKGEWDYKLKAVYCVGILDFTFNDYTEDSEKTEVIHTIQLKNQHGKIFYDKLTYIYVEMPNFKLPEKKLHTQLDKWLYFIRHLEDFEKIPSIFSDKIFSQAFAKAALAKMGKTELDTYEHSLKRYRDLKGVVNTAFDEGVEKGIKRGEKRGIKKGKIEGLQEGEKKKALAVAKQAKLLGLSAGDISKLTGLSVGEIEKR